MVDKAEFIIEIQEVIRSTKDRLAAARKDFTAGFNASRSVRDRDVREAGLAHEARVRALQEATGQASSAAADLLEVLFRADPDRYPINYAEFHGNDMYEKMLSRALDDGIMNEVEVGHGG